MESPLEDVLQGFKLHEGVGLSATRRSGNGLQPIENAARYRY
jgi:hypothetical protein